MNCLFCKISHKEINSHIVYEDDLVMAFLDINPLSPGHTLIIPKEHFLNLEDITPKVLNHLMQVSQKLYHIINHTLHPIGIRLVQNNGSYQEVPHFHIHLIPAYQTKPDLSLIEIKECLKL